MKPVIGIIVFLAIINSYWLGHSGVSEEALPQQETPDSVASDSLPRKLDRVVPNNAFGVGEKLTFIIRYGFIKAGYATMAVPEEVTVRDSFPSYRIISRARSTKGFDLVFKVRDSVESIVDKRGFFSWRFTKKLREGSYKFDLFVEYDQLFGKAYIRSIRYENDEPLRIREKKEAVVPIPKYVLDVLAAFYYVRTQDLEPGEPIYLVSNDHEKNYPLKVLVLKREVKKVKAGTFRTIKVEPQLRGEALFKQKGRIWIWLTDDDRKMPVLMKSKVLIGSITTELIHYEGLKGPLKAKIK